MTLSKGAVGNLINRYRAVLRKCRMMNVFGSLAVAGMLVAGSAGIAGAEENFLFASSGDLVRDYSKDTLLDGYYEHGGDTRVTLGTLGQNKLDITVTPSKKLTSLYSWDYSGSYNGYKYAVAAYVGRNSSQLNFSGTGDFSASGSGPSMEACTFWSMGNMVVSGDITGTAKATGEQSSWGIAAKATQNGSIEFGGKTTTLNASSESSTAQGVLVKNDNGGGTVTFNAENTTITSSTSGIFASVGIDAQYGQIETSANTKTVISASAQSSSARGIALAKNGRVIVNGEIVITAQVLNENPSSSYSNDATGIYNHDGNSGGGDVHVKGKTIIKAESKKSDSSIADSYGIYSGKESKTVIDNAADITAVSPKNSYAVNVGDLFGNKGTVSLGASHETSTFRAESSEGSSYGIYVKSKEGSVTLNGDISIQSTNQNNASWGIYIYNYYPASVVSNDGLDIKANTGIEVVSQNSKVLLYGKTKVDSETAIKVNSGASVTFAYDPTPINVPKTVTDAGSQVNGSVTGDGNLIKSGSGSLAFNGDNSGFSGSFDLVAGTTFLTNTDKGYFSKAKVNVSGGTLVAPALSFASGGKLVLAGGTLVTNTGQVFTTALNAAGDNTYSGGVKLAEGNWDFQSGLVSFDDAKYNLAYAKSAAEALAADYAEQPSSSSEK